jgi:hypothetical protein
MKVVVVEKVIVLLVDTRLAAIFVGLDRPLGTGRH